MEFTSVLIAIVGEDGIIDTSIRSKEDVREFLERERARDPSVRVIAISPLNETADFNTREIADEYAWDM